MELIDEEVDGDQYLSMIVIAASSSRDFPSETLISIVL
jgi:hypothetical protein